MLTVRVVGLGFLPCFSRTKPFFHTCFYVRVCVFARFFSVIFSARFYLPIMYCSVCFRFDIFFNFFFRVNQYFVNRARFVFALTDRRKKTIPGA